MPAEKRQKSLGTVDVESLIFEIRGRQVVLDADLAQIYGVSTKRLNEQVKRNPGRFPHDFVFQLDREEIMNLKSQIATSSLHGGRRYHPYAFTEHGSMMAANVFNSLQAVEMSVFVVRAFVKMRQQLISTQVLSRRLADIEKTLLTHDASLRDLYQKIKPLLLPPPVPSRKKIGFHAKETRAAYTSRKKPQHTTRRT